MFYPSRLLSQFRYTMIYRFLVYFLPLTLFFNYSLNSDMVPITDSDLNENLEEIRDFKVDELLFGDSLDGFDEHFFDFNSENNKESFDYSIDNIDVPIDLDSRDSPVNKRPFPPVSYVRTDRQKEILTKLKQVCESQNPQVDFRLNSFNVMNWPKDVYIHKRYWSKLDSKKIENALHLLKFVPKEDGNKLSIEAQSNMAQKPCLTRAQSDMAQKQCLTKTQSDLELMPCLIDAVLDETLTLSKAYILLIKQFKGESGIPEALYINWSLLDRSAVPEKYSQVPLNSLTILCPLIHQNREIIENIHFKHSSSLNPLNADVITTKRKRNVPVMNPVSPEISEPAPIVPQPDLDSLVPSTIDNQPKIDSNKPLMFRNNRPNISSSSKKIRCAKRNVQTLKYELKILFHSQHSGKYDLKKYDILNWPRDLDMHAAYWTKKEVEIIRSNFHKFLFVLRPLEDEGFGFDTLENIPRFDWKPQYVHARILERFRQEAGDSEASYVRWNLLDRSQLPAKYNDIVFCSDTFRRCDIFRNQEIIDNLHFYKSYRAAKKLKLEEGEGGLSRADLEELRDIILCEDEAEEIEGQKDG